MTFEQRPEEAKIRGCSRKWEQEVPKPEAGACLESRSSKAKAMGMGEERVKLFKRGRWSQVTDSCGTWQAVVENVDYYSERGGS